MIPLGAMPIYCPRSFSAARELAQALSFCCYGDLGRECLGMLQASGYEKQPLCFVRWHVIKREGLRYSPTCRGAANSERKDEANAGFDVVKKSYDVE